jgi:hypothetical protein
VKHRHDKVVTFFLISLQPSAEIFLSKTKQKKVTFTFDSFHFEQLQKEHLYDCRAIRAITGTPCAWHTLGRQ